MLSIERVFVLNMRCIVHIINLIVQEINQKIGNSIHHVRATMKYIKKSPTELKNLKECINIKKTKSKNQLCLDVSTR